MTKHIKSKNHMFVSDSAIRVGFCRARNSSWFIIATFNDTMNQIRDCRNVRPSLFDTICD